MLMTGPGGTGKTYVVNAFHELMAEYNCAHQIRYLAPTGNTAVNLPSGQTIHKGIGLTIVADGRHPIHVELSLEKQMELRSEWKGVKFLFVDEVSLIGAALLSELDAALRVACDSKRPFGGINIIFAGDFYQLPPVKATPLYL
jgi:hypothetical protein